MNISKFFTSSSIVHSYTVRRSLTTGHTRLRLILITNLKAIFSCSLLINITTVKEHLNTLVSGYHTKALACFNNLLDH